MKQALTSTPQQSNATKIAKLLLAIGNATEKKSISACAIGEKQIEKKLENTLVNGATENWQTQVLKKKQLSALLKLPRQSEAKIGAETKCLPHMAATNASAAEKLSECFCRLTTLTTTATWNENQVLTAVAAPRSTSGCARTSSLRGIKFFA